MFIITYDFLGQATWKNVINIFFEHCQREQEKDIRYMKSLSKGELFFIFSYLF